MLFILEYHYHIISYHIVVLKRQNCLKVGTDKPKLKVKCSQYQMVMSRKDFLKSNVLSCRRKVMYSSWEDVTSSSRALQVFGPATGKARLPTVDRLTGDTRRHKNRVVQTLRKKGSSSC